MATVDVDVQQLLIGGRWVGATSGRSFEKTNPFTGQAAGSAAAAGREDARAAVEAASQAFPAWAGAPPAQRRELLSAAAALLLERQEQLAAIVTEETGGTFGWGMFNCMLAAGMLREAAAQAYWVTGEVIPSDVPGKLAMGVRQPAGVVVGIAPWNAPVILGTRAVATPLAYGNTVVLKASEECPRTHAAIAGVLQDAGLPDGVVNLITNAPEDASDVVDELIAHPATRRINFTGSTRVGRIIAENAGRHLKRVLLELGGKAPLIVLADADLDRAVAAAHFGAFMHQGQICMSTERIVVDRSVADEFAARLSERAMGLKVGDPRDPETQIGPLVNAAAIERVTEHGRGRRCPRRPGPGRRRGRGPLLPADGAARRDARDARLRRGVLRSRWSRSSPSTASTRRSAWPTTPSTGSRRRSSAGTCRARSTSRTGSRAASATSTTPTVQDEPQMPFGGVKASGFGRFGGRAALEEFTELRWITVQDTERHYPI